MVCEYHVVVRVLRKTSAKAVARFARLAMSYRIGDHDVVLRGVEELPRPEELSGERAARESCARSGRPVEHEHGVVHDSTAVSGRTTEGVIMNAQFRQHFAGLECEE